MSGSKRIFVLAALSLLLLTVIGIFLYSNSKKTKEDLDAYDQYINILIRDFDADIMYYGDNPNFRERLNSRKLEALTHDSIFQNSNAGYRAIVLWDRNNNLKLSDDDLMLIKSEVEKNGLDMFYIGTSYLDDFCRLGFTVGIREDEKSFEYIGSITKGKQVQQNEIGNLYAHHGLWTEDDEPYLSKQPDNIQYCIVMVMKDYATGEADWNN